MMPLTEIASNPPSHEKEHALAGSAKHLARDLAHVVRGEVRFDAGTRAAYSRDASNYRQIPIGVIIPLDAEDVVAAMEVCRAYEAPILARGGGTSLAGQCCNVAVVFDFSKYMHHIIEVNVEEKWARVQPGLILDDLQKRTKPHRLCYGPDPSTHNHCTFGGMIGNNSCGVHSIMAGRTVDNVRELEILTYDGMRLRVGETSDEEVSRIVAHGGRLGTIYNGMRDIRDRYGELIRRRFPKIPRRVSGYCLDELLPENHFHVARSLVGTECTCVLLLEAKVRLIDCPPCRALAVVCYQDIYEAADHVPDVLKQNPLAVESLDDRLVGYMEDKHMKPKDLQSFPEGYGGYLLVEFGGATQEEANARAEEAFRQLRKTKGSLNVDIYEDPVKQHRIWEIRESGLGATAFVPRHHDTWPGWEDSAVHPENLGGYLRDFRKLLQKYGYECSFYGHFGDGLLHTRIDFELRTQAGIDAYRAFAYEAADLVNKYGGSYSGEHGDGQSRAELLPKLYGNELLQAFREFKTVWDPQWKMNPGKVVEPYRLDENLTLGTNYRPPLVDLHFDYPEDHGDFGHVTQRCVGVGECRREEGGTMCPSYRVTREEIHSTRGRAKLLFEMLQGDVITDGWKSREVKEALDLCLACKGCKGDCPVHVDMATYKAEFLSHYYQHRLRPRTAYAMGFIDIWARLASVAPRLVNTLSQSSMIGPVLKWLGGISQEREIPAFAAEPFSTWFRRRSIVNPRAQEVLLWPDTFNNYFHPETAKAAVEVLEAAGFRVRIPEIHLCCGRPLYDFGFLDLAKSYLVKILDELSSEIESGMPMVGLEPSCVAVFRDELTNILPHDQHARRLRTQTYTLSEFFSEYASEVELPTLSRRALVHGHCHHKAVIDHDMEAEQNILKKMGIEYEKLESGCCGMAGSFGFEAGHFDVSEAVGERVLLPRIRNADQEMLIIADGFSCQEQIQQLTDRRALHMAQVLQLALRESGSTPRKLPERGYVVSHARQAVSTGSVLMTGAAVLLGTTALWQLSRSLKS